MFLQSAELLHEIGATYPSQINYSSPQFLSVEALEVNKQHSVQQNSVVFYLIKKLVLNLFFLSVYSYTTGYMLAF